MAARSRALTTAAALAALAALAAACTSTPQPIPGRSTTASAPPAAPPPEPAPGQVPGVPIPDGRVDAAVDRLGTLAADARSDSGAQALAVAVVHRGKVVFEHGYGTAGRGRAGASAGGGGAPGTAPQTPQTPQAERPADEDTVFPLGALSTPVAATVVATQLNDGRSWSTPVRELMPEFALADPYVTGHATLGDLFAGTLGFPPDAGAQAARLGIDRQALLDRLTALPAGAFRAEARPDDLGPTIAGEAVARAAGTDWATLSERSLFDRLGMDSTSFRSEDYSSSAAGAGGADRAWTDAVAPALGLSASVHDMATWMETVLAGGKHDGAQVIPADPLTAALSPQAVLASAGSAPVDTRSVSRGYGFDVTDSPAGRVVITGGGRTEDGAGADAALTLIPSADLGIVTLATPATAAGADGAAPDGGSVSAARVLNAQFADLAQFGSVQRDWAKWYAGTTPGGGATGGPVSPPPSPTGGAPGPTAPPAPLPQYDGVYTNPVFGQATVRTSNDTTVLAVGPAQRSFRLTRTRGDTFAVAPLDPRSDAAESFRRTHPDATATFAGDALTISFLDQAGPFRR